MSRAIPRLIEPVNSLPGLLQKLVDRGALKPSERFRSATYAAEHGIEKLLMRSGFAWTEDMSALRCYQRDENEFVFFLHGFCGYPVPIKRIFDVLGSRIPFRLEGDAPLAYRWVGWLLNTHKAITTPNYAWDYWMSYHYNPGKWDDAGGGDWHDMDPAEAKDAEAKAQEQWKQFVADHDYLFPKGSEKEISKLLVAHADEALVHIKACDEQLADILRRLYLHRDSDNKDITIGPEPSLSLCWESGDLLSHCMEFIHCNLNEGNMQIDDSSFEARCTLENMSAYADEIEKVFAPLDQLERYLNGRS